MLLEKTLEVTVIIEPDSILYMLYIHYIDFANYELFVTLLLKCLLKILFFLAKTTSPIIKKCIQVNFMAAKIKPTKNNER